MPSIGKQPPSGTPICMTNGKCGTCPSSMGPLSVLHALMGMVEANCAIIEEPEATYALLTAITDYKIALIDRLTDYYPLDLVNLHDDWGHGTSTFLSPQTWRTMIKPHIKRITDFVPSKGLFFDIHSCGYIEPLLPDMVEIRDRRLVICFSVSTMCGPFCGNLEERSA